MMPFSKALQTSSYSLDSEATLVTNISTSVLIRAVCTGTHTESTCNILVKDAAVLLEMSMDVVDSSNPSNAL